MTIQPGANLYTAGFGLRPENVEVPHIDVRIPNNMDTIWPIGKRWIDLNVGEYTLIGLSSVGGITTANWVLLGTSGGALNTLTADSGGPISPTAANINILGTANQITTTGSGSTITVSIPATFIAPGSIAATTTLTGGTGVTATSGNLTATNGNLVLSGAGNKLVIHGTTAASDSVGTSAVMSGTPGTVTITSSAVTTSSVILFARNVTGGTPGQVSISAQSAGSFTLLSTGNETSTFNYLIIN